jgi:hypothetical protein
MLSSHHYVQKKVGTAGGEDATKGGDATRGRRTTKHGNQSNKAGTTKGGDGTRGKGPALP